MYAMIRHGSKQYKAVPGSILRLDKMQADSGNSFETDQVLMLSKEDGEITLGHPLVEGVKVQGTVLDHEKGKKLVIFKRKRRKGYRRKIGHRQQYTSVRIDQICL